MSSLKMPAIEPAKTITILGSTGTIGCNTLNIIAAHPNRFRINALTAGGNVALLAEQARQFRPKLAVIANEAQYAELQQRLQGTGIEVAAGYDAVNEAATRPADTVMSAIVGAAGLPPTLAAIRAGTTVALANKECLVCAGALVMREAKKHGVRLLPVDSEHNAIFQVAPEQEADWQEVARVTITASGGPFRMHSLEQMRVATPEQAVKHPNWNMGAKISVDSATLMNKGLELIEASVLFPLEVEQLEVIIHPQSIIHCLVEYIDGSVLAQLCNPDMRTPIANALAWPERIAAPVKKLDLAQLGSLSFEAPDHTRFPALALTRAAMLAGGSAPATLNAANEIAVALFLKGKIGFLDIVKIIEKTLEKAENRPLDTLEEVLACDAQARFIAEEL